MLYATIKDVLAYPMTFRHKYWWLQGWRTCMASIASNHPYFGSGATKPIH